MLDDVVGLEVVSLDDEVVIVTEKGYGKRNLVKDYRITRRGSKAAFATVFSQNPRVTGGLG